MKFTSVFKHTDSFDNESEELRKMAIRVAQILYPLYPDDGDFQGYAGSPAWHMD